MPLGLGMEVGRVVDKQAQVREWTPGVKEAILRKEKKQGSYAFQSNSETLTELGRHPAAALQPIPFEEEAVQGRKRVWSHWRGNCSSHLFSVV